MSTSQVYFYCEIILSSDSIKVRKYIRRWNGSSSYFNSMIFDLYAVVSKFSVNFAHNFFTALFHIASLAFITTFVGRIRVALQ